MASSTVIDTLKLLTTTFAHPLPSKPLANEAGPNRYNCLPLDFNSQLSSFLDKHHRLLDADSERLHNELLKIRETSVASDTTKLAAFLQTLRLLRSTLRSKSRIQKWWDLAIAPVVDGVGYKRVEIEHASGLALDVLDHGAGEEKEDDRLDTSAWLANNLLRAYLERTELHEVEDEARTAANQFIAKQLEGVLVAYGSKKPKPFLLAIDRLLLRRQHRLQALGLLSSFARIQPPHMHTVTQTAVIERLITCLTIDTSTTAISLALSTLIMFLPHIPSTVRSQLPQLFLIYSRLRCWDRNKPSVASNSSDASGQGLPSDGEPRAMLSEAEWEKLEYSFDTAESTAPEVLHFFTYLYGLYPLNFTSFIHDPHKYFARINYGEADGSGLDRDLIRRKSDQFRQLHVLHPNFLSTTLEDELEDDRWLKADPADVVAECIGLCVASSGFTQDAAPPPAGPPPTGPPPAPPPTGKLPEIPGRNVKTKDIPSGHLLPAPLTTPTRTYSSPGSTVSTPQSAAQLDVDSPPMLPLSTINKPTPFATPSSTASRSPLALPTSRDQMPRSPALRPTTTDEANTSYLQREVMLLKSDLNFERYLKQQHITHIGQLQRKVITAATGEAEAQNMVNANKALKAQLSQANESYVLLKRDTAPDRSQAKKWEAELSDKVRSLKQDERKWQTEGDDLRMELSKFKKDCEYLRQLVVDSESKELLAKQELQFTEVKLEQIQTLKDRIQELEETVRGYQAQELEYAQANDEKETLRHELDTAILSIQARDASAERTARNFDRRIQELEGQLQAAQNPIAGGQPGQFSPQVQTLIDSAVASTKTKYSALKKDHAALKKKYIELDMRCAELQDLLDGADGSGRRLQHPSSSAPTNGIRNSSQYSLAVSKSAPTNAFNKGLFEATRPAPTPAATASISNLAGPLRSLRTGSPFAASVHDRPDSNLSAAPSHLTGHSQPLEASDSATPRTDTADTLAGPTKPSPTKEPQPPGSRWSLDSWDAQTASSVGGKEKKEKVTAKDQVRVRGRGGAQNIGKKKDDKKDDKGYEGSVRSGVSGAAGGSVKKIGLGALLGR